MCAFGPSCKYEVAESQAGIWSVAFVLWATWSFQFRWTIGNALLSSGRRPGHFVLESVLT